ncbi:MAG: hypothetical protein R6W78_14135 [Bacteroidales bacterium]
MKHIIVLPILFFLLGTAYAQNISQGNIPAVVLNSFQLRSPNNKDAKWKLDDGNYHVDFKVNNKPNRLILDYKGNILKHIQDLYVSEIPNVVLETVKAKVTFFDVHDADRLEEKGSVVYQINFKISGKKYFFLINDKGKLLKFTKELNNSEIPANIAGLIKARYGTLDFDYSKYIEEGTKKIYIIKGEIADNKHYFVFNDKAALLKHKQDLKNSEIPVPIINSAISAYAGFVINKAELLEEGGKASYELRLRKSKENVRVVFDQNGKILEVK